MNSTTVRIIERIEREAKGNATQHTWMRFRIEKLETLVLNLERKLLKLEARHADEEDDTDSPTRKDDER